MDVVLIYYLIKDMLNYHATLCKNYSYSENDNNYIITHLAKFIEVWSIWKGAYIKKSHK